MLRFLCMTVTIKIPSATEAELRRQAAALGEKPEKYVLHIVQKELAAREPRPARKMPLDFDQRIARLESWTASHAPLPYPADDSRESIYAGRGE